MKKLKELYPNESLNNLIAKDITFFCRDTLNYLISKTDKAIYEEEILILIKSKDWDWFQLDIDKNTILTYPVLNNSKKIVKYLIENHKYDLTQYNEDISHSVCACINLKGMKMMNYFLKQDIHPDYLIQMLSKTYIMANHVPDQQNKDIYLNIASNLLKHEIKFNQILPLMIENNDSNQSLSILHLLENHPLSKPDKIKEIDEVLENYQSKKRKSFLERIEIIHKWKLFNDLNDNLLIGKNIRSIKI